MCQGQQLTSEQRRAVLIVGLLMNRCGITVTDAMAQVLNENADVLVASIKREHGAVPVEPRVFVDRLGRPRMRVA